ncbi:MAG: hypothetical protein ACI30J_05260 [Paludibacteraceae bacterium]
MKDGIVFEDESAIENKDKNHQIVRRGLTLFYAERMRGKYLVFYPVSLILYQ